MTSAPECHRQLSRFGARENAATHTEFRATRCCRNDVVAGCRYMRNETPDQCFRVPREPPTDHGSRRSASRNILTWSCIRRQCKQLQLSVAMRPPPETSNYPPLRRQKQKERINKYASPIEPRSLAVIQALASTCLLILSIHWTS